MQKIHQISNDNYIQHLCQFLQWHPQVKFFLTIKAAAPGGKHTNGRRRVYGWQKALGAGHFADVAQFPADGKNVCLTSQVTIRNVK